ncbi:hypothetical protein BJ742DRAFT_854638 [Cladochytrium replicatum]|nr:hypothetical protein BJ742DRAFT_854638 [Cladochytrium replicatum]
MKFVRKIAKGFKAAGKFAKGLFPSAKVQHCRARGKDGKLYLCIEPDWLDEATFKPIDGDTSLREPSLHDSKMSKEEMYSQDDDDVGYFTKLERDIFATDFFNPSMSAVELIMLIDQDKSDFCVGRFIPTIEAWDEARLALKIFRAEAFQKYWDLDRYWFNLGRQVYPDELPLKELMKPPDSIYMFPTYLDPQTGEHIVTLQNAEAARKKVAAWLGEMEQDVQDATEYMTRVARIFFELSADVEPEQELTYLPQLLERYVSWCRTHLEKTAHKGVYRLYIGGDYLERCDDLEVGNWPVDEDKLLVQAKSSEPIPYRFVIEPNGNVLCVA